MLWALKTTLGLAKLAKDTNLEVGKLETQNGIPYTGFKVTFGKYGATHQEIHDLKSKIVAIDSLVKNVEVIEEHDKNGQLLRIHGVAEWTSRSS